MKTPSDFTLLFAEDDPGIQAIYKKVFAKEGYRVLSCDNAAQILAELNDEKIDLLVTDLEMPAANTLELFPTLKRQYPKLPVIIVSGKYRNLQDDFLAKGYSITAFFTKPIGVSVLKDKIREVLGIGPAA